MIPMLNSRDSGQEEKPLTDANKALTDWEVQERTTFAEQ